MDRTHTPSRRRPPTPTPELVGTMLHVGGEPGEDPRLDAGLVRAALDRTYRRAVLVRVRDLRARPRTRAGFVLDAAWWAGFVLAMLLLQLAVKRAGL